MREAVTLAAIKDGTNGATTDYSLEYTAKQARLAGVDISEKVTVNSIFEECALARSRWDNIRARAIQNERFVQGEQSRFYDHETQNIEVLGGEGGPRYTIRNVMRAPWDTITARILENRPQVAAYPGTPEQRDILAAEVANRLIEYMTSENDLDAQDFRGGGACQLSGVVGYRPAWDRDAGPPSEGYEVEEMVEGDGGDLYPTTVMRDVGSPTGDVVLQLLTVHDFYTDGNPNIESSPWVVFHTIVDRATGVALLRNAGIDDDPSTVEIDSGDAVAFTSDGTTAIDAKGVLVEEVYYRNSAKVPGGMNAVRVGGFVTYVHKADNSNKSQYPYDHGQLPLALWRWGHRTDAIAPRTHIDDAVPEQVQVNYLNGAITDLTRTMGQVKMAVLKGMRGVEDGGVTYFEADTPEKMAAVRYIDPPNIPPILEQQMQERISATYQMMGVSEEMAGVAAAGASKAARSVAYESSLMAQKFAGVVRNYEECKKRMFAQALSLYRQFSVGRRVVKVLGPNREAHVVAFEASELDGADVRLEIAAGPSRAADAAEAEAQGMQGIIPPEEAMERGETGLAETAADARTATALAEQINAVVEGQAPPAPLAGVDPRDAVEIVAAAIELRFPNSPVLVELLRAYEAAASTPSQPPAQQPVTGQNMGDPDASVSGLETGVPI